MKKIRFMFIFIIMIFLGIKVQAYDINKDDQVFVSGEAIGIKLNSGIEVVGTFGVENNGKIVKPWQVSGIKEGDKITSYNNKDVDKIDDLINAIRMSNGKSVEIKYLRNNIEYTSNITPAITDSGYSLGLYIKDSTLGVGTLTYYLEEANIFGSLGHPMTNDGISDGEIYEATINSITKPQDNRAGEKKATISSVKIGEIEKNCLTGVHGIANNKIDTSKMKELHFKTREEVHEGEAEIWTCIDGTKIERFKINITNLKKQTKKDIKGITFEVVDKKLIEKSGGIVQGMSGSPIVQDDMLVGAVTHVSVKDAKIAYGIYIEWMFEDMDIHVIK